MKMKQFYLLNVLVLMLFTASINAQDVWQKVDGESYYTSKKKIRSFKNFPNKYKLFSLNTNTLQAILNSNLKSANMQIKLPNELGNLESFIITESSNFSQKLSAKFPNIKSYTAIGVDNPTSYAKISMGTDGFHAIIFTAESKTIYIDPYTVNNNDFIVYKTSDLNKEDKAFKCDVAASSKNQYSPNLKSNIVNDGNLRTFRLALICSGEYAQFHLSNQNVPATATEQEKKAAVLSAMNTSITRVNGVFEKELAVKMEIVDDNDKIIFLEASTDNITDGDPNEMIDESQSIADTQIGNANYDIGHIFSIGGDGLAGLGVVCVTNQKAKGVTGRGAPIGDPYDIDFVAHEIGHQFGATHTQNNDCNRTNETAVEPGSASTIMGYAGFCSPDVQGQSDDYFHAVSIAQMQNILQSSGNCATLTPNGNSTPVANAGLDYSIPKSTPFVLKGEATDADGIHTLTYNWEQIDNETATMPPSSSNSVGPMFRSFLPVTNPERYFPKLETVINGNISSTWEVIPAVSRELNFSFLVRDNNATGGAYDRDDVTVTVADAEAFVVTSQNSAATWNAGSSQTVTWNKGTTDIAPINCSNVTIKLSTDGGVTFPIILKENTPNDGSEVILVPNNVTTEARIMVMASDNIFYNVNSTNLEILSTIPTFIITNESTNVSACNTGNQSVDFNLNLDFINGFTENVTLSATGQPAGSLVSFSPTTLSDDGTVVMNVSNLDGTTAQEYTINVLGTSTSVSQNLDVFLKVTASNLTPVTLSSPTNGATGVALTQNLIWQADANAISYDVEVASDINFNNIVASGNVSTSEYTLNNVSGDTNYFWRVKSKNNCNESAFSPTFSFATEVPSYCASLFTDEANGSEHITNVTFAGINNNSGNDTSDGYQDFTSINANVLKDTNYTISVTFDTAGYQDHCYVFIDWNQDFIFDKATERYDLGTKLEDVATATLSINVPADAKLGQTRMRVIIEYDDPTDGFGDGPCDADHLTEWGETEDYSIIVDNTASILDTSFANFNIYPNPNNGTFNLNLEVDINNKVLIQLFDVRGRLVSAKKYATTKTSFSEKITFENTSSGLYLLKVINGKKQTIQKLLIK